MTGNLHNSFRREKFGFPFLDAFVNICVSTYARVYVCMHRYTYTYIHAYKYVHICMYYNLINKMWSVLSDTLRCLIKNGGGVNVPFPSVLLFNKVCLSYKIQVSLNCLLSYPWYYRFWTLHVLSFVPLKIRCNYQKK